jgi:hypothetical protein
MSTLEALLPSYIEHCVRAGASVRRQVRRHEAEMIDFVFAKTDTSRSSENGNDIYLKFKQASQQKKVEIYNGD